MIQATPASAAVNKQILAEQSKARQERGVAMEQAPGHFSEQESQQ